VFAGPDGKVTSETAIITILGLEPGDDLVVDTAGTAMPEGTITVTADAFATTKPTYFPTPSVYTASPLTTPSATLDLGAAQLDGGAYDLLGWVTRRCRSFTISLAS
jgi:hypothetical protein